MSNWNDALTIHLPDAAATDRLGEQLASSLQTAVLSKSDRTEPFVIYLHGPLGAGKSALVRACLRALDVQGTIRSPTYTLVETYQAAAHTYCHMDLYRLTDPEELAYLDVHGSQGQAAVWFVEWPARGAGELPRADVELKLSYVNEARSLQMLAGTEIGRKVLLRFQVA